MEDHEGKTWEDLKEEHFDILEISDGETFEQSQLKKHYRKNLMTKYHPDTLRNATEEENQFAEERSKLINASVEWCQKYAWDQEKWESDHAAYTGLSDFDEEEILINLFGFYRFYFNSEYQTRFETRRERRRRKRKGPKWSSREQVFEHLFRERARQNFRPPRGNSHKNIDFGADSEDTSDDDSSGDMPDLVDAPPPGAPQGDNSHFGMNQGGGDYGYGGMNDEFDAYERADHGDHDEFFDEDDDDDMDDDDDSSSGSMPGLESMPAGGYGRDFGGNQSSSQKSRGGHGGYDGFDDEEEYGFGKPGARGKKKNNKAKRLGKKKLDANAKRNLKRNTKSKHFQKQETQEDPVMNTPTTRKTFDNRIQIKWKKPENSKKIIKKFLLELKCEDDEEPDWTLIGDFPADTMVYTVPDLLPGRSYFLRVKCIFFNDTDTPWSEETSVATTGEKDLEQIQPEVKTNHEYREIALKRREAQEEEEKKRQDEEKRKKKGKAKAKRARKKAKKAEKRQKEEEERKRRKEEEEKQKLAKQKEEEEYEKMLEERRKQLLLEEQDRKRKEELMLERALQMKELDEQKQRVQQLKAESEYLAQIDKAKTESAAMEQRRHRDVALRPRQPDISMNAYAATAPWSCSMCTFENSVDLYWCEICEKGTNPRPSPMALAQKQAREAQILNQPKIGRGGKQNGRGRGGRSGRGRGRGASSPSYGRGSQSSSSPRGRGRRRGGRGTNVPKKQRPGIVRAPPPWAGNTHIEDNGYFGGPKIDLSNDFPTLPQAASWASPKRAQKQSDPAPLQAHVQNGNFQLRPEERRIIGLHQSERKPPIQERDPPQKGDNLSWLTAEERKRLQDEGAVPKPPPRKAARAQDDDESSEESDYDHHRRQKQPKTQVRRAPQPRAKTAPQRVRQDRSRSRSDDNYDPAYDRQNVKYEEPSRRVPQKQPSPPDENDSDSSTPEAHYQQRSGRQADFAYDSGRRQRDEDYNRGYESREYHSDQRSRNQNDRRHPAHDNYNYDQYDERAYKEETHDRYQQPKREERYESSNSRGRKRRGRGGSRYSGDRRGTHSDQSYDRQRSRKQGDYDENNRRYEKSSHYEEGAEDDGARRAEYPPYPQANVRSEYDREERVHKDDYQKQNKYKSSGGYDAGSGHSQRSSDYDKSGGYESGNKSGGYGNYHEEEDDAHYDKRGAIAFTKPRVDARDDQRKDVARQADNHKRSYPRTYDRNEPQQIQNQPKQQVKQSAFPNYKASERQSYQQRQHSTGFPRENYGDSNINDRQENPPRAVSKADPGRYQPPHRRPREDDQNYSANGSTRQYNNWRNSDKHR